MDPVTEARREAAVREAQRLYPNISPVLAGMVFDYIEEEGEANVLEKARAGFYDRKPEKLLEE